MKRVLIMCLCLFCLVGSAQAINITGMELYGGDGDIFGAWVWNGQGWSTINQAWYILGVSRNPGAAPIYGPLLNLPDTTINIPFGKYYFYAEPTALGNNPQLKVWLSDGTTISAIFKMIGESGSETRWTRTDGNSAITLGWASGTADLVGPWRSMVHSGVNDFYLRGGIYSNTLSGALSLLLLDASSQ